jgi:hypothetical protein
MMSKTHPTDFVHCRRPDHLGGRVQPVGCWERLPYLTCGFPRRRGVQEGNAGRIERRLSGFQPEIFHTAPPMRCMSPTAVPATSSPSSPSALHCKMEELYTFSSGCSAGYFPPRRSPVAERPANGQASAAGAAPPQTADGATAMRTTAVPPSAARSCSARDLISPTLRL